MIKAVEVTRPITTPIIALAAMFGLGLFVVGFDNGQIAQALLSGTGADPALLHELTHDLRHAAGFPCH